MTIRERIEALIAQAKFGEHWIHNRYIQQEWKAGNLIPADEVDARIEAAVARERKRAINLALDFQYRMKKGACNDFIAALRAAETAPETQDE